jgi:hypothetical protein
MARWRFGCERRKIPTLVPTECTCEGIGQWNVESGNSSVSGDLRQWEYIVGDSVTLPLSLSLFLSLSPVSPEKEIIPTYGLTDSHTQAGVIT